MGNVVSKACKGLTGPKNHLITAWQDTQRMEISKGHISKISNSKFFAKILPS